MIFLSLLFLGCVTHPPAPEDDYLLSSGSRVELPKVEFNMWTDFISLHSGLDDDCHILWPKIEDDSTAFPPVQTFWVIYETMADVKDGQEFGNVFWKGDQVLITDFPERDGLEPIGFKFPPPFQQGLIAIESSEVSEDEFSMLTTFGEPINALMHVEATQEEDGSCSVKTLYCESPCDDDWSPLGSIYLDIGSMMSVRNVEFRAP